MALSSDTVWEVRAAGSDDSGGAFVTGASGVDRSQQDAAQASGTNLTVDATTNTDVTPDGHTPHADDVGNTIQITTTGGGGAFTVGFYQINSIQSGMWRLDRSPAATSSAGATWALGGALASPGKIGGTVANGHIVYIKADGAYLITTASTNVSGGCISSSVAAVVWVGYTSTRTPTNTDTRPTITVDTGVISATIFSSSSVANAVNLTLDGALQTGSRAGNGMVFVRVWVKGFKVASQGVAYNCLITDHDVGALNMVAVDCEAHGNTAAPFMNTTIRCLSYNNTGAAADGFVLQNNQVYALQSVAYGNGRDGFRVTTGNVAVIGCHAEANGGFGYRITASTGLRSLFQNNSYFNNTSGGVDGSALLAQGTVAVTDGSVFVDAASADFALNATALRGALLRAVAGPVFPRGLTDSYLDIGAAQHADPAAGGGLRLAGHGGLAA